jgi:hypothetical protein
VIKARPNMRVRRTRSSVLPAIVAAVLGIISCASVSHITNLTDSACQTSFEKELAAVLVRQGETPENATALAHHKVTILTVADLGPRPFLVTSSSGTDYSFFVEKKKSGCILRLYGRQKGFVSYTNNLTYIDSRPLQGCLCAE